MKNTKMTEPKVDQQEILGNNITINSTLSPQINFNLK